MLVFNVSHPPACATTLIVALGILPAFLDAVVIMAAVVLMFLTYALFRLLSENLLGGN